MSNKKPNAGKRGKKPALSSESQADKNPPANQQPPAEEKASDARNKPATSAADTTAKPKTQPKTQPRTQPGNTGTDRRASNSAPAATNATTARPSENKTGGWIAPVALLFGLLGTGFSAYLYSQLKALGENTSQQLQSQAEATKTDVSTVRTDLDVKTTELADSLEQTSSSITTALQTQNDSLSAAIEQKSSALSTALEEKSAALTANVEATKAELSSALESKSTALASDLQDKSAALASEIETTTQNLQAEAQQTTVDIATSTASAVQELTSRTELEINNVATSFNTGLALLRERTTDKLSQLDKQISELDQSVQTTNELASRGQRDWVLAEVSYLLRTGVHRVKLAGDVKAGVIAMESASDRLHTLGDINYLPVREQIAEEVAALRRVGPPDIEGLIFKLQHMSKRADTLPLPPSGVEKTKQALAENPAETGAAIGQSLLEKFRGSLKIVPSEGAADNARRARGSVKPTKDQLTASDSLRLHLQAARLSALRHDPDNFSDHMENAINYASEIFDQEDDQVTVFIDDLADIRETNIVPKIPILGSALSLFNKIDSKRGAN